MTSIATINGAPSANAGAAAAAAPPAMGQTDFLRLLTTQLTTQDPFNPVDNTQMVAQMAQFSQVAGIAEMNASLKALVSGMNGGRIQDASNWIGRSMLVEADVATPLQDGGYAGQIDLAGAADEVTVNLVDESGAVVRSIDLGARQAGETGFTWDGKNEAGEAVATGPLRVVVTAKNDGKAVEAGVATWTTIGGVQSPANGGAMRLVTGLGLLSPDAALRLA